MSWFGKRAIPYLAFVVSLAQGGPLAQSQPEMSESAFDVGVKNLPVAFRGNTIDWVLRYGTLAPRSDVESASAYGTRVRSFRSEVFAFVLDHRELHYDRAAEMLTVRIQPAHTRVATLSGHYYLAFNVHRTKLSLASRAGPAQWSRESRPVAAERNAVIATTREWKQTQISTAESRVPPASEPLVFALKLSPDRAKAAKSKLRVAFVCMPRLQQYEPAGITAVPDATGVDSKTDGSFQLPDEHTTYFITLRVNLLQVWLFDHSTGEVYARFTPQGVIVPMD